MMYLMISMALIGFIASAPMDSQEQNKKDTLTADFNLYPNDNYNSEGRGQQFGGDRFDMFLYPARAYYMNWIDTEKQDNGAWNWDQDWNRNKEVENKKEH